MFFILEPEDWDEQELYTPVHPVEIFAHPHFPKESFILLAPALIPQSQLLVKTLVDTDYFKLVWLRRMGKTIHVHLAYPTRYPTYCINELHRYYDAHIEFCIDLPKTQKNEKRKTQPLFGNYPDDYRAA